MNARNIDKRIEYKSRNIFGFRLVEKLLRKMASLEILTVSLILAVALVSVACSSDEIQSDIQIVPDMDTFLMDNPDLKVQPLIKEIPGVSPYTKITHRLGRRAAG